MKHPAWASLAPVDNGVAWRTGQNPGAKCQYVNALFCTEPGNRNIDGIEQLRRVAGNDNNNGTTTVNAWIDAKDLHAAHQEIR